MGRIVSSVTIANATDSSMSLRRDALVDTGTPHLTLPIAWKERLEPLEQIRTVEAITATQEVVEATICEPVRIEIEGFPPVSGEVLFLDLESLDGRSEPLIGSIILQQSQDAVDMLGHRLVHGKWVDLKRLY
jgi:predicted aspartyl protease